MTPDEIRALTRRPGWTVVRLAREMGVTRQAVQFWMSGRNKPQGPAQKLLEILARRR